MISNGSNLFLLKNSDTAYCSYLSNSSEMIYILHSFISDVLKSWSLLLWVKKGIVYVSFPLSWVISMGVLLRVNGSLVIVHFRCSNDYLLLKSVDALLTYILFTFLEEPLTLVFFIRSSNYAFYLLSTVAVVFLESKSKLVWIDSC